MNGYNEGFRWCSGKPTAKNYSEFIWHSENAWSGQNVCTIIITLTMSLLSQRKSVMNKFKQCMRCAYLASVRNSQGSIVSYKKSRPRVQPPALKQCIWIKCCLLCHLKIDSFHALWFFSDNLLLVYDQKTPESEQECKIQSDIILVFHVFPFGLSYHLFVWFWKIASIYIFSEKMYKVLLILVQL